MKEIIHKISLKPYAVLCSFIVIGLVLYSPIFSIGYISDDWGFVYQMEKYGWSAFSHNFTDKFYIPVSHFLGTIQYQITGGNPLLQHVIQVLIHGTIAWQIFMICKDISIKNKQKEMASIGLIAGLLFLINPFQVESVSWLASKSYGYTLLFSLFALRILIRNKSSLHRNILFWLLTLIAIHCKEWAYVLPFIAILLMKLTKVKIDKHFWLGLLLTLTVAFGLRYLVLGTFVGGYESSHSFNLSVISIHTLAYLIKFTTYIRFASSEFLPLPLLAILSIIFGFILLGLLIKARIRKLSILYFFCIIILTLLPIAGLEITSFTSNQSDRYSYFALVPFSIIYAYVFINLKKWIGLISLSTLCGIFIFFTIDYNNKWQNSSIAQYTFLEELFHKVDSNSRVLLYNIPDTYNDIYCIRNGIEPYLKVRGKEVDIEVYQRQNFHSFEGGSTLNENQKFSTKNAQNTFTTFPKDIITDNRIRFNWEWMKDFDKTLIYCNTKFTSLAQ